MTDRSTTGLEPARWNGKIYTDGWTQGLGESIDIFEPATGGCLGQSGIASANDVYAAATRATAAQVEWAKVKPAQRCPTTTRVRC